MLAPVMEDYIEILVVVMCSVTDTANRVKRFQKLVFFPLFMNNLTLEWLRKSKEKIKKCLMLKCSDNYI